MKKSTKIILAVLAAVLVIAGIVAIRNRNAAAQQAQAATTQAASTETTTAAATAATTAATTAAQTTAVTEAPTTEPAKVFEPITVLYTNDIHSYIYNTKKDKDGNEVPGLRLSNVAAYREKLEKEGKNVLLLDCGDEIQGSTYGLYDEGETVIKLMNMAGYQAAAVGNHEFQFGVDRLKELAGKASYPFLSCTFRDLRTGELVFRPTTVLECGGRKIGIVGITTPAAIASTTPKFYQNEAGEYIYTFDGIDDNEAFYASVQAAVDSVRDEVDLVIAIGHVGCGYDEVQAGDSSYDVIKATNGIDIFLDGHSHTKMESVMIQNKDGKDVPLTQTGSYLDCIGQMEISADGSITDKLISEGLEDADPELQKIEDDYNAKIQEDMGNKIAVLDTTLYIKDPKDDSRRLIRSMEMNSGDFTSDTVYWFFNEKMQMNCDVVISNGGGIRSNLPAGDVSSLTIKEVVPFNNQACLIEATGQQILDCLEMGATQIGNWDENFNTPAENGGFMQVAGLKYTIDGAIETSVVLSEDMFDSVAGEYKVKDVQVYNRKTKQYEPLDVAKTYTVGGINYILRNSGNGCSMFAKNKAIVDFAGTDFSVFKEYVLSFAQKDGYPYVCTENSPLAAYENYQLNYEDPYGAGRITILNARGK